jgi:hypothetical protein
MQEEIQEEMQERRSAAARMPLLQGRFQLRTRLTSAQPPRDRSRGFSLPARVCVCV